MADKSPAFQFYPKDFLSDDAVALMTNEQIGAYVLLLCHAWLSPSGLPPSLSSLAKLAHCTPARFERCIWDGIKVCFDQDMEGHWFNPRLEQERAKQSDFRDAASRAGKRSAEVRRLNARSTPVQRPLNEPTNGNPTLQSAICNLQSASTTKNVVEGPPPPPTPSIIGRRNLDRMSYGPIVLWASWFRDDIVPLVATHFNGDVDAAYTPALQWVRDLDEANRLETPSREALAKPRDWWKARASERWGAVHSPVDDPWLRGGKAS